MILCLVSCGGDGDSGNSLVAMVVTSWFLFLLVSGVIAIVLSMRMVVASITKLALLKACKFYNPESTKHGSRAAAKWPVRQGFESAVFHT